MVSQKADDERTDLPDGLPKPALRALEGAGLVSLEAISKLSEAELLTLHGVGPKAIDLLRRELTSKGMRFSSPS